VTRHVLLLPALATALALSACSGAGSAEDDAAAAKASYVEQASAACDRAAQERDALTPPSDAARFAPYVRSLVEIAARAERDLAALEPPAADRAALQSKLLDPLATSVEQGEQFATKVEAAGTDQQKLAALVGQAPTAAGIDLDFLRSYGLNSCVTAISTTG
jgi:hypothetical protein